MSSWYLPQHSRSWKACWLCNLSHRPLLPWLNNGPFHLPSRLLLYNWLGICYSLPRWNFWSKLRSKRAKWMHSMLRRQILFAERSPPARRSLWSRILLHSRSFHSYTYWWCNWKRMPCWRLLWPRLLICKDMPIRNIQSEYTEVSQNRLYSMHSRKILRWSNWYCTYRAHRRLQRGVLLYWWLKNQNSICLSSWLFFLSRSMGTNTLSPSHLQSFGCIESLFDMSSRILLPVIRHVNFDWLPSRLLLPCKLNNSHCMHCWHIQWSN